MFWVLLSCVLTLGAGLLLCPLAIRWQFMDSPEARKVHLAPTPRTGGLAMAFGGALTLGCYLASRHTLGGVPWQTLAAGTGFLVTGALDDRFSFHPRKKILWFLALSLLAAWPWAFHSASGSPYLLTFGKQAVLAPRWLAFPVLALWFLAVPNAVNIEDAINGYMGGFTLILLLVALKAGVQVQIPIGALVGFLLLNWPKARHFMGDAGSFGCGFFIAEALLQAGANQRPHLALIVTAPISMDVAMGIIRRFRLGMSLFEADRLTCPHHLLALCKPNPALAAPILWGFTIVVVVLSSNYLLVLPVLFLYALILVWLNRRSLFPRTFPQGLPQD